MTSPNHKGKRNTGGRPLEQIETPPCEIDGGCPIVDHCGQTGGACAAFRDYVMSGSFDPKDRGLDLKYPKR